MSPCLSAASREEGDGHEPSPPVRACAQNVAERMPFRNDPHGEGQNVARPKPADRLHDWLGFLAGVGEEGDVGERLDLAMCSHERHGGGLDART